MKYFAVTIYLFIFQTIAYANFPSLGDGSDTCDFNNSTLTKSLYNCTTLSVQGILTVDPSVTSAVTIRVLEDAHIYGTINFKGDDGTLAIALGKAGGFNSASGPIAGSEGKTGFDATGIFGECGGGGGGGAAHNSSFRPSAGAPPLACNDGTSTDATSGAAATLNFGSESNFESEFYGGAGGGNGSTGLNAGVPAAPGTGGAGGGAIRIIAGGIIEIHPTGSIVASGGNGGDGATYGGGGGGASGGSIFLQSKIDVINNGSILALGGTGGSGNVGLGDGGNGAKGRIRVDDLDGVVGGSGAINPSPYTLSLFSGKVFSGTLSCGTIQNKYDATNGSILNTLLSLLTGFTLIIYIKKKALYSRAS